MRHIDFDDELAEQHDEPRGTRRTGQYRLGDAQHSTRIAFMLALAGYDPARIPVAKRLAALHVAWCLQQDMGEEEVADHVRRPLRHVRTSIPLLRDADFSLRSGKFPFCTP